VSLRARFASAVSETRSVPAPPARLSFPVPPVSVSFPPLPSRFAAPVKVNALSVLFPLPPVRTAASISESVSEPWPVSVVLVSV
jgi:hypothetical protein